MTLLDRLKANLPERDFSVLLSYADAGCAGDETLVKNIVCKALGLEAAHGRTPKPGDGAIPKQILQFWDEPTPPADIADFIEGWRRAPEFRHHLFTDASAEQFISTHFSAEHVEAYHYCHHPAMRCDFFRLCFLLLNGGVYIDADVQAAGRPLSEMIDIGAGLLLDHHCVGDNSMVSIDQLRADGGENERWRHYFNNNPIAVRPGHPVIEAALARATREILSCKARNERCNIHWVTGPDNMTFALFDSFKTCLRTGEAFDFAAVENWPGFSHQIWNVSYRNTNRNWRYNQDVR